MTWSLRVVLCKVHGNLPRQKKPPSTYLKMAKARIMNFPSQLFLNWSFKTKKSHCERSELRLHFEWTRTVHITRQVNFKRTKIGGKCQNWKMRHFEQFSNNMICILLFGGLFNEKNIGFVYWFLDRLCSTDLLGGVAHHVFFPMHDARSLFTCSQFRNPAYC